MKPITGLSIMFCLWSFSSAGQTDETRSREAIQRWEKDKSNRNIGRPLPDFSATTWDGRKMNNATMLGNVYLLIVFFPDCHCFSPGGLKQLQVIEAAHKDFHIVPVLQDTAYLYVYRQEHPKLLRYAVTDTREQAFALKLGDK